MKSKIKPARPRIRERQRLKETQEVLGDADMMLQIRAAERYFRRGGKGLSFEEVFGEPLRRREAK